MISLLRQDNSLSANTLANSLGITQRQAQRILSKLKDEGKLLRHGAKKWLLRSDRLKRNVCYDSRTVKEFHIADGSPGETCAARP